MEALGVIVACSTYTLSMGSLSTVAASNSWFSHKQLFWLPMGCFSFSMGPPRKQRALQVDTTVCIFVNDPIKKNLFKKIWAIIFFGLGWHLHLLFHCKVGLQCLWPVPCGKGCAYRGKVPVCFICWTHCCCLQGHLASHSTRPGRKTRSAG